MQQAVREGRERLEVRSESSAAAVRRRASKSLVQIFVARKISDRATPEAAMPAPTSASLPYIRAVSMCR